MSKKKKVYPYIEDKRKYAAIMCGYEMAVDTGAEYAAHVTAIRFQQDEEWLYRMILLWQEIDSGKDPRLYFPVAEIITTYDGLTTTVGEIVPLKAYFPTDIGIMTKKTDEKKAAAWAKEDPIVPSFSHIAVTENGFQTKKEAEEWILEHTEEVVAAYQKDLSPTPPPMKNKWGSRKLK